MIDDVMKEIDSQEFSIYLKDERGFKVEVTVYGIKVISKSIGDNDISDIVAKLFPYINKDRVRQPKGDTDILIGMQYAGFHPICIDKREHLLLEENRFGYAIAGSHPMIKRYPQKLVQHAVVLQTMVELDSLHSIESLGVSCTPKCGSCRCGKCHPGGKNMTIIEEEEGMLIESKMTFQPDRGRFLAPYPWKIDPNKLPYNRSYAHAMLLSTEKRLSKNNEFAALYQRQIEDMLNRNVARKVTETELQNWQGPKFFISHHGIMNPGSISTPYRIVFNSSHKYMGFSLNESLAKGPSFMNDLLGLLLRYREKQVAFVGDISKMYHSVDIPIEDQMVHLFLWRDMDRNKEPDVYAITVVNMGDKPAAAIAQIALKKTAEMAPEEMEEAKTTIIENSYMDDILGSCETTEEATKITGEISNILVNGEFSIKEWAITGMDSKNKIETNDLKTVKQLLNTNVNSVHQKVLGMYWDTKRDLLLFCIKIQDTLIITVTKRIVLSTTNSIYDPIGLLCAFISKMKILLRVIWTTEPKIEWDDELPDEIKEKWIVIMKELKQVSKIKFRRSLKPSDAIGDPELVIFSDGSKQAYGAVAYIRWNTKRGYECRLLAAKSKIAPLKVRDIVRIELCGATIGSRLRKFIENEMKTSFRKCHHFVDSNIVKGMILKGSYGHNTFDGNRIGEIHRNSKVEEWHWIEGEKNIADIITRGASPLELGENSIWQIAPEFLSLHENDWPIDLLPIEEPVVEPPTALVAVVEDTDSIGLRIVIERFSRFMLLIHTTARVLKLYKRYSKNNNIDKHDTEIIPCDIQDAIFFWVKEAQRKIHPEIQDRKYIKLQPVISNNIIYVGGRTERWMEATWNKQKFILLPKEHRLSYLIALYKHQKCGHLASDSTVAFIRAEYWIVGVKDIVNSIISKCGHCKRKFKKMEQQIMSPLPIERVKPSPAFFNVGVDYFGPYSIKGEVQQRIRGKGYGVIFTCLFSRAVHVDLANDYSTNGFLLVFRRFVSIRGYPQKIFSDNGKNLVGASNELKEVIKGLDWNEIKNYGADKGTEWIFSPANAPWYNGATEALVKSVKRALNAVVGEHIFCFNEYQTVLFEAAQLVNQRPIGVKPRKPNDGSYLCPNDLVLGRASPNVPQGPFKERCSHKYRFDFVQKVVQCFWKRWTREIFPSLVISPKWHVERRNVKKGDVVLIDDANELRGKWTMGIVVEASPSHDGRVRRVSVNYKNPNEIVQRAVQKLIVLVPIDENQQ